MWTPGPPARAYYHMLMQLLNTQRSTKQSQSGGHDMAEDRRVFATKGEYAKVQRAIEHALTLRRKNLEKNT